MDETQSLFLRESDALVFRCLLMSMKEMPMALKEMNRLVQVYCTESLGTYLPIKTNWQGLMRMR
jgi:hypothetical protein